MSDVEYARRATARFVQALTELECGHWVYTGGSLTTAAAAVVDARQAAVVAWVATGECPEEAQEITWRAMYDSAWGTDHEPTYRKAVRILRDKRRKA